MRTSWALAMRSGGQ